MLDNAMRIQAAREIAGLGETQTAVKYLAGLVSSISVGNADRSTAAREIPQLGDATAAAQAFVALLQDDNIDEEIHAEAMRAIAQIDDNAVAISTFAALAQSYSVAGEHRLQAAREIARLGDMEMAIYAYSAVAEDEWAEDEFRIEAARELLKLSNTAGGVNAINAVLSLANDIGVDMGFTDTEFQMDGAMRIAKSGDIDAATDILMNIVKNEDFNYGIDASDRLTAAYNIAEIGAKAAAIEAFKILAEDDTYTDYDHTRSESALELVKLGDAATVIDAFPILAEEISSYQVKKIAQIDDKATAARILVMLVEDDSAGLQVQAEAYQSLLKLVMSL